MNPDRAWDEIVKLVMVADMDDLLRAGLKDPANSLVKTRGLLHLAKIRGRREDLG